MYLGTCSVVANLGWLAGWLDSGSLAPWLAGWLDSGCLAPWLAGWLAGLRLPGWLPVAGWLAGWRPAGSRSIGAAETTAQVFDWMNPTDSASNVPAESAGVAPFQLAPLLPGAGSEWRVRVADVGALALDEGGDVYTPLQRQGLCDVVGFEPAPGECETLNRKAAQQPPGTGELKFFPTFVGDGSRGTFHLCSAPMTSSLFEPNTPLLEKFHGIEELCRVVSTEPVTTTRLDTLYQGGAGELGDIDLLKIDVQGAELAVIEGATDVLAAGVSVSLLCNTFTRGVADVYMFFAGR